MKVKILLVLIDSNWCKIIVSEVIKELKQFIIKIVFSNLLYKILICEGNRNEFMVVNGVDKNGCDGRDCLELMVFVGFIVKGLFLKVFDESGKQLWDDEFKFVKLKIIISWSEVRIGCQIIKEEFFVLFFMLNFFNCFFFVIFNRGLGKRCYY